MVSFSARGCGKRKIRCKVLVAFVSLALESLVESALPVVRDAPKSLRLAMTGTLESMVRHTLRASQFHAAVLFEEMVDLWLAFFPPRATRWSKDAWYAAAKLTKACGPRDVMSRSSARALGVE